MNRAIKATFLLLFPSLLLITATNAWAATPTTVNVTGQVTVVGTGLTVTVHASASGSASSLSGAGVDSAQFIGTHGTPGECTFSNLAGSVVGSVVTLSGSVTESTNSALVGTPVTIIGDASSGAITFLFGSFTLTGTGSVVIT